MARQWPNRRCLQYATVTGITDRVGLVIRALVDLPMMVRAAPLIVAPAVLVMLGQAVRHTMGPADPHTADREGRCRDRPVVAPMPDRVDRLTTVRVARVTLVRVALVIPGRAGTVGAALRFADSLPSVKKLRLFGLAKPWHQPRRRWRNRLPNRP